MAVLRALSDAGTDTDATALYDDVTGLPGRALLRDRAVVALARARRSRAGVGMLLALPTSTAPDEAAAALWLRRVALAIVSVVRADDTVACVDDRLVVLCNDVRSDRDLAGIATRLGNVLRHQHVELARALVDPVTTPDDLLALAGG